MKKYLLFFALGNLLLIKSAFSCPCELSLDDKRPFFEQHDYNNNTKEVMAESNKKEEEKQ